MFIIGHDTTSSNQGMRTTKALMSIDYTGQHRWMGTGFAEKMRLTPEGDVGMGITSPATPLHIKRTGATCYMRIEDGVGYLTIGQNSGGQTIIYNYANQPMRFGTNGTERMRITSAGYVGIGTTNPTFRLQVSGGGIYCAQTFNVNGTGPASQPAGLWFADLGAVQGTTLNPTYVPVLMYGTTAARQAGIAVDQNGRVHAIRYHSNAGTYTFKQHALSADLAGYLPLTGTAADSDKLNGYASTDTGTVSTVVRRNSAGDINCRLVRPTYQNQTTISGAMAFRVNNSTDNYIRFCSSASSVRTWLGAAASSHTHSEYASSSHTHSEYASSSHTHSGLWSVNGSYIYYNNRVGISDSTPSYELDVTGTIRATSNVIAYSDIRVKDDIRPIKAALDTVKSLMGKSFIRLDHEDKRRHIGVIAQEIEEYVPEVVDTDDHGMKSVAYGPIVALLIEAIKELDAKVEAL
jgi:hypothetical protein